MFLRSVVLRVALSLLLISYALLITVVTTSPTHVPTVVLANTLLIFSSDRLGKISYKRMCAMPVMYAV